MKKIPKSFSIDGQIYDDLLKMIRESGAEVNMSYIARKIIKHWLEFCQEKEKLFEDHPLKKDIMKQVIERHAREDVFLDFKGYKL